MDVTFVLCPNLLGVLGLSILLVFTRFNYYLERKKLNLFRVAAVVNLAIIAFEVLDFFLGEAPSPSAYIIRRVTSATGFALSPIFPLLLTRISSNSKLPLWIYIPATSNLIISYASMFTGHVFLIDECNSYYRGPLFAMMLAISIFYMVVLIYVSFKNLRSVRASESVFLICIATIIVIGNLLEIFLYFHFIIWNSCAMMLICYYLFIHIQYFKFDPLTGAFNRNVFTVQLENLKQAKNIGVISFDLDNLKKINDMDGHESGDEYIVTAARLIGQCFSDIGHLYRIGGDEFIVLASNTDESIMQSKMEVFDKICHDSNISVSCGYSFHASATDLSQMIRDADKAMYENKRNRKLNRY